MSLILDSKLSFFPGKSDTNCHLLPQIIVIRDGLLLRGCKKVNRCLIQAAILWFSYVLPVSFRPAAKVMYGVLCLENAVSSPGGTGALECSSSPEYAW